MKGKPSDCNMSSKLVAIFVLLLLSALTLKTTISASSRGEPLHIKLTLFTDAALSKHLVENVRLVNKSQLQNLLVAYVKQVEANISGLRSSSNPASAIHLELAETRLYEPDAAPNGDIDQLLDQFCAHQAQLCASNAPANWRLSLLLTALDLYSGEEARGESGSLAGSLSTMGVSVIDGINWPNLGCLIVELGANYGQPLHSVESVRDYERLNPSRGFASTWVAAHEIGHSLGLHHDGPPFNPDCHRGGVMSSESSIISINSTWSRCSLEKFEQLIETIARISNLTDGSGGGGSSSTELNELPGQMFGLHEQCKTFGTDLEHNYSLAKESICDGTVWCQLKTNSSRLIPIGPALEGSFCDELESKLCIARRCIRLAEWMNKELSPNTQLKD